MNVSSKEIRDVLMNHWDPIGVCEIPEAKGEYDAYISDIKTLLSQHATFEKLFSYLLWVEKDRMGLTRLNEERIFNAANELIKLLRQQVIVQSDVKDLAALISNRIEIALKAAGFVKQKKGYIYPISEEVQGMVSPVISTLYTTPRTYKVNASIGVRHNEVETLVAQARKEKEFDETFFVFLGYICPNHSYKEWSVVPEEDFSGLEDFIRCVVEYGIPFIKASSSLERIKEILESGNTKRYPETLVAVNQLLEERRQSQ